MRVTNGELIGKDGIEIVSDGTTISFIGPQARGSFSGGIYEGLNVAIFMDGGAYISEISSGDYIGIKDEAVSLIGTGTRIGKISGGNFFQKTVFGANQAAHGQALYVGDNATIGEISGGHFESAAEAAVMIIRGAWIDLVSGGVFVATNTGVAYSAIQIEGENKPGVNHLTGIGTISGGTFHGPLIGVWVYSWSAEPQAESTR